MSSRSTIPRTNGSVQVDTSCPVRLSPHRLLRGLWIPLAVVEAHTLSPGARLLYGALAYHARRGDECWPSERRLAKMLSASPRQVRRYLAELVQDGWIQVERSAGRASTYRFLLHPAMRLEAGVTTDKYVRTRPDRSVRTPRTDMSGVTAQPGEIQEGELPAPPSPPQGGAKNRRAHRDQNSVTRDLTARAIEYARRAARTSSSP
jgi:hypothetical protein